MKYKFKRLSTINATQEANKHLIILDIILIKKLQIIFSHLNKFLFLNNCESYMLNYLKWFNLIWLVLYSKILN